MPVRSSTRRMHVLERGDDVLDNPRVVRILDTMFGADFSNFRSNVRVPTAAHPGEQVMLNLKVKSSSKVAGDGTSVGARSFNLRLEPVDWFTILSHIEGWITVSILKVVR